MALEELTKLMVEHGLVIRAIPYEKTFVVELHHKDKHPTGVVYYDEIRKREMLRVTEKNSQGGKFIIASKKNQDSLIHGSEWDKDTGKKVAFYDSIEQAVNSIISKEVK